MWQRKVLAMHTSILMMSSTGAAPEVTNSKRLYDGTLLSIHLEKECRKPPDKEEGGIGMDVLVKISFNCWRGSDQLIDQLRTEWEIAVTHIPSMQSEERRYQHTDTWIVSLDCRHNSCRELTQLNAMSLDAIQRRCVR